MLCVSALCLVLALLHARSSLAAAAPPSRTPPSPLPTASHTTTPSSVDVFALRHRPTAALTSSSSLSASITNPNGGVLTVETTTRNDDDDDDDSLHLHVSAAPPDPLGIGNVSGFYGPGTWAAWFLTVVGSWCRFVAERSEDEADPNLWAFLLGTNWAALDLFRALRALGVAARSSPDDAAAAVAGHMGACGAAWTVVFWGVVHGLFQIYWCIKVRFNTFRSRRLRTLVAGLVFPMIALLASLSLLSRVDVDVAAATGGGGGAAHYTDLLPALYWSGMNAWSRRFVFFFAALTPIPTLAIVSDKNVFGNRIQAWLPGLGLALIGAYQFAASLFLMWWMVLMPGTILVYVAEAYLGLGSSVSGSCFFMPCAPQSITDEDQLYALLAGLFLLVAFEIAGPLYRRYRGRGRAHRDSLLQAQRTLDRARILRSQEAQAVATEPGALSIRSPTT